MKNNLDEQKIIITKAQILDFNELNQVFPQTQEGTDEFNRATGNNEWSEYLLARDSENKIIGKLYLKFFGSNNKEINKKITNCPDIENLEVTPSFRGKGVGTKLILKAEEICKEKGFHKVGLGVSIENREAQKLYESLGYKDADLGIIDISFMWKSEPSEPEYEVHEKILYLIKEI